MQVRAHTTFASVALALLSLAGLACGKPTTSDRSDTPGPSGAPPQGVTSATLAPSAVAVAITPSASASVEPAPTSPPSHGGPSPTVTAAASHAGAAAATASAPAAGVVAPAASTAIVPGPVQYATTSAAGSHYSVSVSARTECAVGTDCSGTITLTASGGYHINDEYPYRFVVDEAPGAEWLSTDGKGFGKTTGDFKKTAPTVAELGLRYRGKQAGPARLSGTYKMSVCSEANCQVETVPLSVSINFR